MKIAIHNGKRFNIEWRNYCHSNGIAYKLVNCYSNSIIHDLSDCDALMWHFEQENPRDVLFAKQLLYSVQSSGKRVFPDFNTVWHFDDKVGQKYLLESIGAPLVPSYVFYTREEAIKWLEGATFPLVNKLRTGSASIHVKKVSTRAMALRIINKSFKRGFRAFKRKKYLLEQIRRYRAGIEGFECVLKGMRDFIFVPRSLRGLPTQKGYVYFQEFIPDNDHNIRLIIIGDRAFGIKRLVRHNDFRASGSGILRFGKELFPEGLIKTAFDISDRLKTQCIAMDFLHKEGKPLLVEISFGFPYKKFSEECPGYWDRYLNWHEGKFNPYGWMVENVIKINR